MACLLQGIEHLWEAQNKCLLELILSQVPMRCFEQNSMVAWTHIQAQEQGRTQIGALHPKSGFKAALAMSEHK